MSEPFYIRQTAERMTDAEARHWFHQTAEEAYQKGATWGRYSEHPEIENLRIVEAWKARPDDEGDIRWFLIPRGREEPTGA